MTTALRLIFAGTPDFAAAHLQALIDSEHEVVAVYTQPDRPAGRGKTLSASPVKKLALANALEVYQPPSFKDAAAREQLAQHRADIMIVVAYGLILPQAVLDIPPYGCINVHASLLPRWRGAAPIQRAIEAGDSDTGVTIMQMEAGLDTGPMLKTAACAITPQDTASTLHDRLARLGPPALLDTLADLQNCQHNAVTQNDDDANYAHKLLKTEALIDWQQSAESICRRIRAFNPFPACYTLLGDQRLKIYQAQLMGATSAAAGTIISADENGLVIATGDGSISIEQLQLPGGKAMTTQSMLNARRALFSPGTVLGAT